MTKDLLSEKNEKLVDLLFPAIAREIHIRPNLQQSKTHSLVNDVLPSSLECTRIAVENLQSNSDNDHLSRFSY